MATQLTSVGIRNTLKIGSGFLAGFLAASYALYLGGNIGFDTTLVTNPAIKTGTSAIIQSYDGQTATVATNTGGRVHYSAIRWTNPSTATQSILNFKVDVPKLPGGSNDISCAIGPPGFTNSGSVVSGGGLSTFLFKHRAVGSGSTVTASGNNLALLMPPGWGGRCWFLVTPGAVKAKARILTGDQYIP